MLRKGLVVCLGLAAVALGSALLGALTSPRSLLAAGVNAVFPIPDVSAARYERALALARYAPAPARAEALKEAQAAATEEIRAAPFRPQGWIGLAAARAVADGGPSPRAIEALGVSYQVSACDRLAGPARIRLALEAWPQLPDLIRARALAELKTLYADAEGDRQADERRDLASAVTGAREPTGRAAGEAALATVGWSPSQ
jgi:hypothetical protein